jgi:ATP-dependent DNA helicase PIF1
MNLAMDGHNVFVGGKPGTGKTYTVKRVVNILKQTRQVKVSCTTGMACSLYDDAMTLHSFAGIKNSRMNVDAIVSSVMSQDACKCRWLETDVLVIDEVSQLSAKNFELINILAQQIRGSTKLFGGLQVICVGDFFQLPPIENDVDEGKYCFESTLWQHVFSHSIVLKEVYRQDPKEKLFLSLLDEFAMGECSEESLRFVQDDLCNKKLNHQDFGIPFVPHIFCNNFDATYFNLNELDKLPGERHMYTSIDTCREEILNKVTIAEKHLVLKIGAEVILLYNLSNKLTNGTRGQVTKLEADGPTVNFYNVGITCKLTRASWFAYKTASSCHVIGQRDQYPLKLAWGITAHKSQGQTLLAAHVHSGREFVPGQLYVAASRVSTVKGLSLLQFNPDQLIKANSKVVEFYKNVNLSLPLHNHQCCKNKIIETEMTDAGFQYEIDEDPLYDELFSSGDLANIDAVCQSYFDSSVDSECVLDTVDQCLLLEEPESCDPELHDPETCLPDNICVHSFLEKLKDTSVQACVNDSLGMKINNLIRILQGPEVLPKVKTFIGIQWDRLSQAIKENIKKKKDGSTSYDFKGIMAAEVSILNMKDLSNEFSEVLGHNIFSVEHHCLITELVKAVRVNIISQIYNYSEKVVQDQDIVASNVWDMSEDGKGKVRYVGGWTIIKLIYGHKRYITQNIASNNQKVRQEMSQRYLYIFVLESLLAHSSNIHSSTEYKGTLSVTDMKQYRKNSLVHISDKAFQLFMHLEQLRVDNLCHHKLNTLQHDFLAVAIENVKSDKKLQDLWLDILVGVKATREQKLLILGCIIDKFFKMGAGQYIRDFRRDHNIQKTEAHRKRVQERKLVKERVADKVTLEAIKQDTSHQKQDSHNLLIALVTKRPDIFNSSAYTKKEIKILFQAYEERFVGSWKKEQLNEKLVLRIKSEGHMKNPKAFDNC